MDIQSQLSTLLGAHMQTQETLQNALKGLSAREDAIFHAAVQKTLRVDQNTQNTLLARLNREIEALKKTVASPPQGEASKTGEKSQQLAGLQARAKLLQRLIQTQKPLYLLEIKIVANKLNLLSERIFSVGDQLSFRVRPDGELSAIVKNPAQTNMYSKGTSRNQNAGNTNTFQTSNNHQAGNTTTTDPTLKPTTAKTESHLTANQNSPLLALLKNSEQELHKSLRQHLPLSAGKNHLMANLLRINHALNDVVKNSQLNTQFEMSTKTGLHPKIIEHLKVLSAKVMEPITAGEKAENKISQNSNPLNTHESKSSNILLQNTTVTPKLFNTQLRGNTQILSPQVLQFLIKHSGTFLENQLQKISKQIAQQEIKPKTLQNPGNSEASTRPNKLQLTSEQQILRPINNSAATPLSQSNRNANISEPASQQQSLAQLESKTIEEDNKVLLLRLQNLLNTGTGTVTENAVKPTLKDPIVILLQLLGLKPNLNQSRESLKKDLINELKQQTTASLARIQTLQLRSLLSQLGDSANQFHSALELHFKVNDNIYPITLYFQERYVKDREKEDKEKDERKKRHLSKQWKVFMQFETEEAGWFASEVSYLHEGVNTRFWAQKEETKKRLKSEFDALREQMQNSGLEVEDILFIPGEPPLQQNNFTHNLVDLNT